ncbi:AmmeMemoRadiSam system protein B [archaeon]|nr:AmmeMemoRadiSam system protein B [archaeon]
MIMPNFAGVFYEGDASKLRGQIEACFKSEFGPGELPGKREKTYLKGILVPHAGYMFSGPCASWAYKEIAETNFPRNFIILAPDHIGTCKEFTTTTEEFATPLGIINIDKPFISEMLKKCSFIKKGAIKEHAVEVQLPFLRYASQDKLEKLQIVPLIIPSIRDKEQFKNNAERLGEAVADISEDVAVIISSDFTHYGPNYGYMPFESKIKENIKKMDDAAIDMILNLNAWGFYDYSARTTICGRNAFLFHFYFSWLCTKMSPDVFA